MSSLVPIEDDALLAEVLAHTSNRGRKTKSSEPQVLMRDYNTWFKLKHRYRQVIQNLPELSKAKCSNPACPEKDKERGAIGTVVIGGVPTEMCRICFLDNYPEPTNQLELS